MECTIKTVLNSTFQSINEGSLEITSTVPSSPNCIRRLLLEEPQLVPTMQLLGDGSTHRPRRLRQVNIISQFQFFHSF